MAVGNKSDALRDEITSAMLEVGIEINAALLIKCQSLCSSLRINATSLAEAWEAYSLNKRIDEFTEDTFFPFKNSLLFSKQPPQDIGASIPRPGLSKRNRDSDHLSSPEPKKIRAEQSLATPTPQRVSSSPIAGPSYLQRTDAGKVALSFDPNQVHFPDTAFSSDPPKCNISSSYPTNASSYRYMFTPLVERAALLDADTVSLSEQILESHPDLKESLEGVAVPRQENIVTFGRVCNEAHEGRLNANSVYLEGSRAFSGGKRVALKLETLEEYSLYSGQVVVVKGYNPTGRVITAEKILEGVLPCDEEGEGIEMEKSHAPLRVLTTCGPYSLSNGEYTPLQDFLSIVKESKPDVVILSGPFIDANIQSLDTEDGTQVPCTYETIFQYKIMALLELALDSNSHTQVLLVPSLDDSIAAPVFPQPPFQINQNPLPNQIRCLSNPATFSINNITFGITSTDVLLHLSSDEIRHNSKKNRMAILAEHLLKQRSFYPLFPAHPSVPLEWKQAHNIKIPVKLDFLLTPSKFTPFCKIAGEDTLVLNSGKLSRGLNGGFYGDIRICPGDTKPCDRTRVVVKKI